MRFWRKSSSNVEEPGLRERLDEAEGALEAEQRHNARMLVGLRNEMQGKIDGVVATHEALNSALLKRVAPKMKQSVLANYVPNSVALRYCLPIMARTDKDFGRAPVAAVSGDEVVYRANSFDKRCSLVGDELVNLIRSAVMSEDFDSRKEYKILRGGCELFVSSLPSAYASAEVTDSYLIRMVPLAAGRKRYGELGKAAVAHIKKAVRKVITPNVETGGAYATE
ncbi:hypothetical protein HN935_03610 [archaeon]|jgi:hypothetical protein|nr:hypothetical protein [archaeon]